MVDRGDKKRDLNATDEQKQILLNFMEDNIDFGKGKFMDSVEGKKKYNSLWGVLTQQLNSTEAGPSRETVKWQRFWSDMKTRVKKKTAEIKKSRGATGGGPQNSKYLTDMEERILFFISPEAAYGVEDPEKDMENVILESDIPKKRKRIELGEEIREEAYTFSEQDISAPNTPTSEVESLRDFSPAPGSSTSHQPILHTPSSSKKKKVITGTDVSMLLQQQTELNMQMVEINSKLDCINSTLESNNQQTNQLLERIAVALEKWSDN